MDRVEAQRILAVRVPGRDDDDPRVAEALALARQDPDLGRWLEGQGRFDAAVRKVVSEIAPPAGLRERILEQVRPAASGAGGTPDAEPEISGRALPWWRRSRFATAAAAAVLAVGMLSAVWLSRRGGDGFDAWRGKMVAFVSVDYKLDLHENSFDRLHQRLVEGGYPAPARLSAPLAALELEGGSLLDWNGHKVTLVCMESPGGDVWLFLAERAGVPGSPEGVPPVVARSGRMATASWGRDGLVFLLVTEGDEAAVRKYLDP